MSSKWTHAICDECWKKREPDREPHRFVPEARVLEGCCFCLEPTRSGIYVREDPALTKCNPEVMHDE